MGVTADALMRSIQRAIIVVVGVALLGCTAMAGTVTLTGSCSPGVINGSAASTAFTLSNSGNQTATSLTIVPSYLWPVNTYNESGISIQYLAPAQNVSARFYFRNVSPPGSYSIAFTVAYQQGTQTFYALFPCTLDFGSSVPSLASISSVNQTGNALRVTVVDLASSPINVSVTAMVPPPFYASPPQVNGTIARGSQANFTFHITYPKLSGASYTVAVAASYLLSGQHHSSFQPYVITFPSQTASRGGFLSQYLVFLVIALIVIIIVGLIVVSLVKGRKKEDAIGQPQQP